jgi:hypothetical protein
MVVGSLVECPAVEAEEMPATDDLNAKTVEVIGWPEAYVAPGGKIAYR